MGSGAGELSFRVFAQEADVLPQVAVGGEGHLGLLVGIQGVLRLRQGVQNVQEVPGLDYVVEGSGEGESGFLHRLAQLIQAGLDVRVGEKDWLPPLDDLQGLIELPGVDVFLDAVVEGEADDLGLSVEHGEAAPGLPTLEYEAGGVVREDPFDEHVVQYHAGRVLQRVHEQATANGVRGLLREQCGVSRL